MKIKAILYDLGDIFFEAHFWRKWLFEELRNQNRFSGSFFDFYSLWEVYLLKVYQGQLSYSEAFVNFIKSFSLSDPSDFVKRSYAKKEHFEKNRSLYKGVMETLSLIKLKGIDNIVITDNEKNSDDIRNHILKKFNLNKVIETVFTSLDFGLTKNNPLLFTQVLAKIKMQSDEVLFVGHDGEEIQSAKQCKIRTILFNNYLEQDINSDFKIESFNEILNLC